jgi:hypothetical protein
MAQDVFKAFQAGFEGAQKTDEGAAGPPAPLEKPADATLPDKLERLVHRSIDRANELYDLPLDPGQPGFQAVVRANTALVSTALTTQARVDETNLKRDKGNADVLNELIERIREARARVPRLCDDDPI